jgi:hypothetical protein
MRSKNTLWLSPFDSVLALQAANEFVDDELYVESARAFATTAYNGLLARAGKDTFVDKTPRYHHILPFVEAVFPNAKKIFLNRNPLDMIASCKLEWNKSVGELIGEPLTPFSFDYTVGLQTLALRYRSQGERVFVMQYEALVENPTAEVSRLCEALGLGYEPRMISYAESRDLMRHYAASRMGDRRLLDHRAPHTQSIGRWQRDLAPEEVSRVLLALGSDLFVSLGYPHALGQAAEVSGLQMDHIPPLGNLPVLRSRLESYAVDLYRLLRLRPPRAVVADETEVGEVVDQTDVGERIATLSSELDQKTLVISRLAEEVRRKQAGIDYLSEELARKVRGTEYLAAELARAKRLTEDRGSTSGPTPTSPGKSGAP